MEGVEKKYFSALTVDVEDGVNIAMKDFFNVQMDPTERVLSNMDTILSLFNRNHVKATFFILGEVVAKYPELLRRIDAEGHEVGVHGYNHDQIFRLTPEKLKNELIRAKGLIEEITGKQVHGFRAPAFSINQKTAWALQVIEKTGFIYDSSIFPSRSLRYGWKGFPKEICRLNLNGSRLLIEVPLSVFRVPGKDIPVGGGGYLRYFPYWWTRKALKKIVLQRPAIIYLHPYELDTEKYPDFFYRSLSAAPLKRQIQLQFYRYKKNTVASKLDRLTREFVCAPMIEIIQQAQAQNNIKEISLNESGEVEISNQVI
jgi:polysaccharide deacetylase family protein (PEP-CTERM system associated)